MQFKLVGTTSLALMPQTMWIWHSQRSSAFIVGDERVTFALPESNATAPTRLTSDASGPCNLPVPAAMHDQFAATSWHGFRFLDRAAYAGVTDGDLLRTLVFGPNYGHYVLHPAAAASGAVLALRSGAMQLLRRSSAGFEKLDQTKTRGKAALAFAAHPSEPLIVYGDNYGVFHAHRFDPAAGKFASASKITDKQRKASRVEFGHDGKLLVIGGMGYLSTFTLAADGTFAPAHDLPMSVRDFHPHEDGELVIVNQGMNGIAAYRYDPAGGGGGGFTELGDVKPPQGAVHQTSLSKDGRYLGITIQSSPVVSVYAIESP